MAEEARTIMEHFARAKGLYHRLERGYDSEDLLRAVASVAAGVKLLISSPGTVVGRERLNAETALYGMLQALNRVEELERYCPDGLWYEKTPGGGKKLLVSLLQVLKRMQEDAGKESLEEMRARKLRIDRHLNRGGKVLELGKLQEAGEEFKHAVDNYVDEHLLFRLIAERYAGAGHHRPAVPYLLRALEANPDDPPLYILAATVHEALGKFENALEYLNMYVQRYGEDAEVLALSGRALLKAGQLDAAEAAARKALEQDPVHVLARKVLAATHKRKGRGTA